MKDCEEIIEFGADEDALFLTEDIYDKAIIGVCDGRVCYDEDKVITILMEYTRGRRASSIILSGDGCL